MDNLNIYAVIRIENMFVIKIIVMYTVYGYGYITILL